MAETVSEFFRLADFNIGCLQVLDFAARYGVLSIIRDRTLSGWLIILARCHVVDN
jgi:hypothetical protein